MSGDELAAIPVEEGFSIAGLETLNPKPSSPYIEPHEDLHTSRIALLASRSLVMSDFAPKP